MKKTIELIKSFFEEVDWEYNFDSEKSKFTTGLSMGNILGYLDVYIHIKDNYFSVIVCLNSHSEEVYLQQVAEYLHRVNFGLRNGNFELDFNDGEIRYKTYVSFENVDLSKDIIEESILIPIFMFEKYGKNLMKLMIQKEDPKALAFDAENVNDSEEEL